MSEISETSFWLNFFTEAGIPPSDATGYAITFTDNRIKQAMLLDLNKEYLRDMGIDVMGDIIAILKHAKKFSGQLTRQKVFPSASSKSKSNSSNTLSQTSTSEAPVVKKSTAATRMLEHYVRKEPPPPLPSSPSPSSTSNNLSPSLSARLGGTKRSVEDDEPSQSSKRSSVFNRLGDNCVSSTTSDSPKITITMLGKEKVKNHNEAPSKSYSRLNYDTCELPPSSPSEERRCQKPLQYHGVLKYSAKEMAEKSKNEKMEKRISSLVSQTKSDSGSTIRSRLGAATQRAKVSEGIFAHESEDLFDKSVPNKTKLKSLREEINKPKSEKELLMGKNVITKVVKINKKTGQIVREEKREIRSNVFNRLGN